MHRRSRYTPQSRFHLKLLEKYDQIRNEREALARISTMDVYERACARVEDQVLDTSIHEGDQKIDAILSMLDRVYRSPQQKEFHKMFIASSLRFIYGDAFDSQKHRVTEKYKFQSRNELVLVCCPRRFGKTYATALYCVVAAICLPTIEFSIFSPAKRQSIKLMQVICEFLDTLNERDRIIKRNEEVLYLQSLDGRVSKINAYPSNVQTLRGVSANVMIMEEFAQIDPRVLFEVVVPLLQLNKSAMIGISTVTDSENFMTKFMDQLNDHGESLFHVARYFLACEACRKLGEAAAVKCPHNAHLLPMWSNSRKRKLVNSIMKGQEMLLAQEIVGMTSGLHRKAFDEALIASFVNMKRAVLDLNRSFPYVFISIDPNGLGKSSDYAIVSAVRDHGHHIIIGLESFQASTAMDNDILLIDHVTKLRQDMRYKFALMVFIFESNLSNESSRIAQTLKQSLAPPYLVMMENDLSPHVGFHTTNSVKLLAVETLRERLAENTLEMVPEPISISQGPQAEGILIEQMKMFNEIICENKNPNKKPTKFYNGKTCGKDDLVMTLLLSIHWTGYFYRAPKYATLRLAGST